MEKDLFHVLASAGKAAVGGDEVDVARRHFDVLILGL